MYWKTTFSFKCFLSSYGSEKALNRYVIGFRSGTFKPKLEPKKTNGVRPFLCFEYKLHLIDLRLDLA